MKSIKELMMELGFSPDAPEATKKAFINHLVKDASLTMSERESDPVKDRTTAEPGEQLSFDLDNSKRVS